LREFAYFVKSVLFLLKLNFKNPFETLNFTNDTLYAKIKSIYSKKSLEHTMHHMKEKYF